MSRRFLNMSEMMSEIYDVAVVGAGPAGAFFARELARLRKDVRIALIDGQTEARKKPCGGLLAPDAQKLFAQLDMTMPNSVLADPQIFTVQTIDIGAGQTRYYQRHYLNMDRYRFDKWLLSLVPETVHIISDRVKNIERAEGVYRLTLHHGEITAHTVVGADGSGSCVRRMLGKKFPKQYTAVQEWYRCTDTVLPYYSCIFDKETSSSCSWTIHKDGYVIFGGAFERSSPRKPFEEQKKRLEHFIGHPFGEPIKREACLVSSPRSFFDFCCGRDGAYLIGEAAGFISASSFEGISYALCSGRLLAQAFARGEGRGVLRAYRRSSLGMRLKLCTKIFKRAVLCTPWLRFLIMRSGIQSIKPFKWALPLSADKKHTTI